MRPAPQGGLLKSGNFGNHGGGSLPEWYKQKIRDVVDRPSVWAALQSVLEDSNHKHYAGILRLMIEQGYGKPVESSGVLHQHVGLVAFKSYR